MKATLEFNLPEEESDFRMASTGSSWHGAMWELDQYLRGKLKHGHAYASVEEALEDIRKQLHEEMENHNLHFEA